VRGARPRRTGSDLAPDGARRCRWICRCCGLSITPRADWLAVEYCPRCLARRRAAIRMVASPLPASDPGVEDSRPAMTPRSATRARATGAIGVMTRVSAGSG
jgi:hypothetical protein